VPFQESVWIISIPIRPIICECLKSPVKSCSLDPVPTFLLREFVDLLLSFVTCMVNTSLRQGRLPKSQRHAAHAIVVSVLKKPELNTYMANFRPVSNVTFMSKIVERVAQQLHEYLAINDLLPSNQSAYSSNRSTETAMRVISESDSLSEADEQRWQLLSSTAWTIAFTIVTAVEILSRENGSRVIDVVSHR